jgi:hypothetical protein
MTTIETGIRPDPAQPVPPTGRSRTGHLARVAGVVLTSLALLAVAVWPQLSARFTGDEVVLRVQPVDPIDPFRGAYVDLGYPDLPRQQFDEVNPVTEEEQQALDAVRCLRAAAAAKVWVGGEIVRTAPATGST